MATTSAPGKPDLASLRIHDGQRKGSQAGKRVLTILLVLLLLGGIAAAAAYALRNTKPVVDVTTVTTAETGAHAALNASGYVTPRRRATIAAKITGRVTSVHFDEGTRVQEGQLLATLDDSDVQRALSSAPASAFGCSTPANHDVRLPSSGPIAASAA